jgi:predicted RNA-binding Zn ribbon-like protein
MALEFDWPGQALALDLADTVVVMRPGEEVDLLTTEDQLARWLALERDRVGDTTGAETRLRDFHRLRDALRALLAAATHGAELPADAVAAVNRASAAAPGFVRLRAPGVVDVESTARTRADAILGAIAASAVELLGGPDRERLRNCTAPRCGGYFLAGRARQEWCCTACGNRARVARHYARRAQRAASTATPPLPAA